MSRRKRKHAHANHERWLVSYADFITLLFAFFVVLYASSEADQKKTAAVAASIKGAFQQLGVFTGGAPGDTGTPGMPEHPELTDTPLRAIKVAGTSDQQYAAAGYGIDVKSLRQELEDALGDEIRKHEVQMRMTPEGLVVSLREIGFFKSGEADLLQDGQQTLARIAGILGGRGFEIRIEGHTDNIPIHNTKFKSNWELSTTRATQVVALLIEHYHFNPELISAAGYSQYRPMADNDTDQGRAANRRIDLIIVGKAPEPGKAPDAAKMPEPATEPAPESPAPAATQ